MNISNDNFICTLLQFNPKIGDLKTNAEKIIVAIKTLKTKPDLIITTELALQGYPPKDLLFNNAFTEASEKYVDYIAKELKDYPPLLLGTITKNKKTNGKPLFNSTVLLKNGERKKTFHKTLLPNYDVFDETRYFEPGKTPGTIKIKNKTIGITICEDIWNEKNFNKNLNYCTTPLQHLNKKKVDMIINLSASPFIIGKQKNRDALLKKITRTYQIPIIYSNQVGGNDDLVFDGRSCAFSSDGKCIAMAKAFDEDILTFTLSKSQKYIQKKEMNAEEEAWHALVLGTKDYVHKCGFKKAVIGLSGGIDSAITAAIAVNALGKENVLGVMMPSPYSSQGSVTDAEALAKNLGIQTLLLPIADIMTSYDQLLKKAFENMPADITEENIQARIRGNLLMALSNKHNALLLTTGNKSELSVGYCTIYGDMAGALAVISDIPKTMVYKICEWLNLKNETIPTAILEKPPSAELRPNQKDQDSLPDYEILDAILKLYIEDHQTKEAIIKKGFDKTTVEKIITLVTNSEFKRKQAAPGIKITDCAFGTGWRMPIAAEKLF